MSRAWNKAKTTSGISLGYSEPFEEASHLAEAKASSELEWVLLKQAVYQKPSQLGHLDLGFLEYGWVIFHKILHQGNQKLLKTEMASA